MIKFSFIFIQYHVYALKTSSFDGMVIVLLPLKNLGVKMELMQIIVFSLKLFIVASIIIISISYSIYKIKNRSTIKPYLRPSSMDTSKFRIKIVTRDSELQTERAYPTNDRFKVLNDSTNFVNNQPQYHQRLKNTELEKSNYQPQYMHSNSGQNIFSYYSNNNLEPMHKLKQ